MSDDIIFQVELHLQNLTIMLLKYLSFWLIFMQRNITTTMSVIMKSQSRFKIPKLFPPCLKSVTPLQKLSPTLISVFTQVPYTLLLDALRLILSTPLRHFGQIKTVSVPRHLLACSQVHIYILHILVLTHTSLPGMFTQKQMCHIQIPNETKKQSFSSIWILYTNANIGNITNIPLETRERKIILMLKFLKFQFVFHRSVKNCRDM
jgi:hypothetical protein